MTPSIPPSGVRGFRFSVRDTGLGIAKENQRKIFEAFSQEDSSTTKKYGGTGLGLSISNKLLALMASGLQLHSEQGKGRKLENPLAPEGGKAPLTPEGGKVSSPFGGRGAVPIIALTAGTVKGEKERCLKRA